MDGHEPRFSRFSPIRGAERSRALVPPGRDLQDEIVVREERLAKIDERAKSSSGFEGVSSSLREDGHDDRKKALKELTGLLKQYIYRVNNFPDEYPVNCSQVLDKVEAEFITKKLDLIAVVTKPRSPLRKIWDSSESMRTWKLLKSKEVESSKSTSYHSTGAMETTVYVLSVGPIDKLGIITAFIIAFTALVAVASVARPFEVLAGTAALTRRTFLDGFRGYWLIVVIAEVAQFDVYLAKQWVTFAMPSDDEFVVSGGPLRLKGGKIEKRKKKKKNKDKTKEGENALANALSTGQDRAISGELIEGEDAEVKERREKKKKKRREGSVDEGEGGGETGEKQEDDEDMDSYKTEAERKLEEAQRKKVCSDQPTNQPTTHPEREHIAHGRDKTSRGKDTDFPSPTQLLKLAEQPGARPELLKTHKQRVEELNTYLSKLSEHHDMPKIGPG
ncbi:hypothetical protein MKZ38_008365 [Zalerion maritima]|uniref:DUF6594 domain-containing protein n=1 Tax=Zalerion maritima TaxID=339359 RepID=A0AAD5WV65_9PEZI|nr:hypothetical protein MKZ38_008365 [Zalerion maritima]